MVTAHEKRIISRELQTIRYRHLPGKNKLFSRPVVSGSGGELEHRHGHFLFFQFQLEREEIQEVFQSDNAGQTGAVDDQEAGKAFAVHDCQGPYRIGFR